MVRILFREIAVGCPLYVLLGTDPLTNLILGASVFAILLALTRRSSLLKRRTGLDVVTECVVVFFGALAFRNVLVTSLALLARP